MLSNGDLGSPIYGLSGTRKENACAHHTCNAIVA